MSRTVIIAGIVAIIFAVVTVGSSLFVVQQGEQAVILQFGQPKRVVRDPGLNMKLPFFLQDVRYFDKRVLDFDVPAEEVLGADQKRLVVDSFIRYRIVDPLRFMQSVNNEVGARARLGNVMSSSLRQVFGNVTMSTILSNDRADIMRQIRERVASETGPFGIEILDVRLRRVDLPEENSQAIYARMQSERERVARETRARGAELGQRIRSRADRERTVILAEAERQGQITRGSGDAEATKVYADAYGQGREFFDFFRSLAAYRRLMQEDDTTLILSPDSELFRYLKNLPAEAQGLRR
jgi:membrane protease subunit HflC